MGVLRRPTLIGALIGALVITLAVQIRAYEWQLTASIEFSVRDLIAQALASSEPERNVVLIDINEQSLQTIRPWPWPRETLARISQALLADHGAKLVALDIVLPNARDSIGDQRIAQLAESGRLVLSQAFDFANRDTAIVAGVPAGSMNAPLKTQAVKASGYVANHSGLSGAKCVGNIGFIPDLDGKLRRVVDWVEWNNAVYPSLSQAILICLGSSQNIMNLATPLKPLRFDRGLDAWTVIPALELLQANTNPELPQTQLLRSLIQDRVVIIGSSALGLADRVATPLSSNMAGMFVHAQAVSELLGPTKPVQPWLESTFRTLQLLLVGIFGLGVLLFRKIRAVATLFIAAISVWLLSVWLAYTANLTNSITASLWGLGFSSLCIFPLRWAKDRLQAERTIRLLSRYLSKPILQEVLKKTDFDPFTPRRSQITVLVADMAAYTATTESLSLENAALVTKKFLEAITEPVWANRGTLDQYLGDGLIAFWGAPLESIHQADEAVNAAVQMLRGVQRLSAELSAEGLPEAGVRIGIASGEALVGDFGTQYRTAYTAVGKCINMAARLQSLAKDHPDKPQILLSQEVANQLTTRRAIHLGGFEVRGLGELDVYGLAHWLDG